MIIHKNIKKYLIVIIISIYNINCSIAEDLKDFEIEGVSIGQSLLDYASIEEINSIDAKFDYKSDEFITYRFEKIHKLEQYDKLNVSVKKNDKNYKIVGVSGIYYYKNLDECNSLKKEIQSYIIKEFNIVQSQPTEYPSSYDDTGKSMIYGIQNYLKPHPDLESININCYDFTKESMMEPNLKVSVYTHDFMNFIINN